MFKKTADFEIYTDKKWILEIEQEWRIIGSTILKRVDREK
jgi:hypothetical protein